ncbi:MAG: hypothetical protein KAI66_07325 [Lentisphaeria bacterium]|nr:hypothetical protein [Lentisphaeria bacterium]
MRGTISICVMMLLLSACSKSHWDETLGRSEVDALLKAVVKAGLPSGAAEVYGRKATLGATTVDVRFACTSQELSQFLVASSVLADQLQADKRTVLNSMSGATWWKPDELSAVSGTQQNWKLESGNASGLVVAGSPKESDKMIVYLCVTIE